MPRSDEQPDYIHTFTNDGEGKSKTTRIAPIEVGRDNAPLTRVTMDELDESKVRNATTGTRILHMDPAGELRVKDPNGNSREVRGADSLQSLVGSPVTVGGTADLEVRRGQAVEDDAGVKRLTVGFAETRLENDSGGTVIRGSAGSDIKLFPTSSEPLVVQDEEGVFDALTYTTSDTPPGTLELENAQLVTSSVTDPIIIDSFGAGRAVSWASPNNTGTRPKVYANSAGEVVAEDEDGNVTELT